MPTIRKKIKLEFDADLMTRIGRAVRVAEFVVGENSDLIVDGILHTQMLSLLKEEIITQVATQLSPDEVDIITESY
ncbi:MAG: hypothetical protein AAF927_01740 [Bacteroidota bacterium]